MAALEKIGNGVFAWIGANGDSNAGAVLTSNGLLAIDAQQTAALGRRFRTGIENETGRRATQLVDTHFHLDHTAGNVAFSDIPIIAQEKTLKSMRAYMGGAEHNRWRVFDSPTKLQLFFGSNVQELLPAGDPLERWFIERVSGPGYEEIELQGPTETFTDRITFECSYGALHAEYLGPAHCDGDVILHIPQQKVAFLGDLLFVGRFPWLGDCDLDGWIQRLDYVLTLDIGTVVPGHGGLSTLTEVAGFRDLLTDIRLAAHCALAAGQSEDALVSEAELPQYAALPRYREWLSPNLRAAYRYLKR